MSYKKNFEVPRHYNMIAQLANCFLFAVVASSFSPKQWVIIVSGIAGWLFFGTLAHIATSAAGMFFRQPFDPSLRPVVWRRKVIPMGVVMMSIVGLSALFGLVREALKHYDILHISLLIGGMAAVSLALSAMIWVPRSE